MCEGIFRNHRTNHTCPGSIWPSMLKTLSKQHFIASRPQLKNLRMNVWNNMYLYNVILKTWSKHRESKFCRRTHICIYKCLLNNVYRMSCIVSHMLQPKWNIFPNPNKNNHSWPCPKTHRNKTPHNQRTKAGANQTNHVRHLRGRHEAEFWGHGSYSKQIWWNNYPTIRKVTISVHDMCIISFVYLG